MYRSVALLETDTKSVIILPMDGRTAKTIECSLSLFLSRALHTGRGWKWGRKSQGWLPVGFCRQQEKTVLLGRNCGILFGSG